MRPLSMCSLSDIERRFKVSVFLVLAQDSASVNLKIDKLLISVLGIEDDYMLSTCQFFLSNTNNDCQELSLYLL